LPSKKISWLFSMQSPRPPWQGEIHLARGMDVLSSCPCAAEEIQNNSFCHILTRIKFFLFRFRYAPSIRNIQPKEKTDEFAPQHR